MTHDHRIVIEDAIMVPNRTASLDKVRSFVINSLEKTPLDERGKHLLVLAIDEAVTSNILFSVDTSREGFTRVSMEISDVCVRILIEDTGKDLDASQAPESVINDVFNKARKHEMGIFLIRQIVDEISYAFKKGYQNQLILTKFL